jgi:hypothetical protein
VDALHVEEVCFGPEREKKMIKVEIQLALRYAACATNKAFLQIYALHIGFNKHHTTKNASERINNVAGIKIAGGDFVQHRRE